MHEFSHTTCSTACPSGRAFLAKARGDATGNDFVIERPRSYSRSKHPRRINGPPMFESFGLWGERQPLAKNILYTASSIGPLSRMNDNAHYPSQIGRGWAMAYISANAVHQTETGKSGWRLVPQSSLTSSGISLQYLW